MFIDVAQKGSQKHLYISVRWTFFQKNSLMIAVLRWMMRFLERNASWPQKRRRPNGFAKKRPEVGKKALFLFFGYDIGVIEMS